MPYCYLYRVNTDQDPNAFWEFAFWVEVDFESRKITKTIDFGVFDRRHVGQTNPGEKDPIPTGIKFSSGPAPRVKYVDNKEYVVLDSKTFALLPENVLQKIEESSQNKNVGFCCIPPGEFISPDNIPDVPFGDMLDLFKTKPSFWNIFRVAKKDDPSHFYEFAFLIEPNDHNGHQVTAFGIFDRTLTGEKEEGLVKGDISLPVDVPLSVKVIGKKQFTMLTKESSAFLSGDVLHQLIKRFGSPPKQYLSTDGAELPLNTRGLTTFSLGECLSQVGLVQKTLNELETLSPTVATMTKEQKLALLRPKPTSSDASSKTDSALYHKIAIGAGIVFGLIFLGLTIASSLALGGIPVPFLILLAPKFLIALTAVSGVLLAASLGVTGGAWWTMPKSSIPGMTVSATKGAVPTPILSTPGEDRTCGWMFDCMHQICPDSPESEGYERLQPPPSAKQPPL